MTVLGTRPEIINLSRTMAHLDEHLNQIIVSTHPRTNKQLNKFSLKADDNIKFLKPFGFLDYVNLQMNAACTISNSGTISAESAILSFPAISLRQSIERPAAQDAGPIILTGFEQDIVLNAINIVIAKHKKNNYE